MKTLLLTSAGLKVKEEILKILPKPAAQLKVAHIITASKGEKNRDYVEKDRKGLLEMGFNVENVDIEGKNEGELRAVLSDKDIIYVQGGNTFYLLKFSKESGFDKIVNELIEKGIIYIGVSAGSYIACPTIEMSNWKHQDRDVVGLNDLSALNLVPFLLSAHYRPENDEVIKAGIAQAKYPVRILTDEQAILVQDDNYKLVGEGSEIML